MCRPSYTFCGKLFFGCSDGIAWTISVDKIDSGTSQTIARALGEAALQAFLHGIAIVNKLARQAGDGVSKNVAVVKAVHLRITAELEPEAMDKLDIVGLDGGCVRTDVEAQGGAVRFDDVEGELTFGFGKSFPSLSDVKGLLFGGEFGGQPGDDGGCFERICSLDEGCEDIARWNDEEGDMFAEAFRDGYGFGKEHLLVFAEELLGGVDVLRSTHPHHAGGEDDEVLLVGVGMGEGPLEREGSG